MLEDPSMEVTNSEEASLLREVTAPAPNVQQLLVSLNTFTPTMLTELSTHIDHLRKHTSPAASANTTPVKSSTTAPPGLPPLAAVRFMQETLLQVTSNLGTDPTRWRTPTCPPSEEETTRTTQILVRQMSQDRAPGTLPRQ